MIQWIDNETASTAEIRLGWMFLHFRVTAGQVDIDNSDGWGWDHTCDSISHGKQLAERQWALMKADLP